MPQKYSGVQQRGRVPNVEPVGMSLSTGKESVGWSLVGTYVSRRSQTPKN